MRRVFSSFSLAWNFHRYMFNTMRRVRGVLLMVVVAVSASSAMAALPTVSNPSRGVTAGNYLKLFQDYLYDFGLVIGLTISAFALFKVASGAITIYHEVQEGKKKWGDMGMHLGVGVGLLVAIVFLVTQASGVL